MAALSRGCKPKVRTLRGAIERVLISSVRIKRAEFRENVTAFFPHGQSKLSVITRRCSKRVSVKRDLTVLYCKFKTINLLRALMPCWLNHILSSHLTVPSNVILMDLFILLKYYRISKFSDYICFFFSTGKTLNKPLFSIIYKAEQNKNCPPPQQKKHDLFFCAEVFFFPPSIYYPGLGVGEGGTGRC